VPFKPISQLSLRQFQTLTLLADGLEYNQIAIAMQISINGVRGNIKSIYRKLDVTNNVQASKLYWQYQFEQPSTFKQEKIQLQFLNQ
jgi:DNA-binding CsgD family transcriptional regulator